MLLSLISKVAIGAAIGGVVGYFGKCSSGACPLTSTWWRGAIYGAVLGLLFFAGSSSGAVDRPSKNVTHIEASQFDAIVSHATEPVVVDFYASWCGPCKMLAPILDDVAGSLSGKAKFIKVDVDAAQNLAQRYGVEGVPTLMVFKGGKPVDALTGVYNREELKSYLEKEITGTFK